MHTSLGGSFLQVVGVQAQWRHCFWCSAENDGFFYYQTTARQTFLMLTGLHIHLSALGARPGHFFPSSAQGHHLHSHKSFLSVVLCNCSQMRLTPFGFCPLPHHSIVACYFVSLSESCLWITVTKSLLEKKKQKDITPEEPWCKQPHPCETVGPGATQTTASVKCLQQLKLTTTTPSLHPHKTSPSLQIWKTNNIITSQTAAQRILIEFNCRRDWTQRSCCVRLIRDRLCPEGQL